jgi:murein endopeptidase
VRALYLLVGALVGCAGAEAMPRTHARSAPRTEASAPTTEATAPAVRRDGVPEPGVDRIAALRALDGSQSTSIGAPAHGCLEGAIALPDDAPGLRSNPRRPNASAIYGTVEMVQALVRRCRSAGDAPGTPLTVNDIGLPDGGPIAHHGSHRAGATSTSCSS